MKLPRNRTAKDYLEMTNKLVNYECPVNGEVFIDCENRTLTVCDVNLGDRLGREIIGKIDRIDDMPAQDYSCSLELWAEIWRDKSPRQDPRKMKC